MTKVEQIPSITGAEWKNKKVVKTEGLTTFKVEHKGLEPEIDGFQNSDNRSNNKDKNITHQPNSKHFTRINKTGSTEDFGQISDNEKHIIDTLRAQYEHNEIPKELVKLIRAWPSIPESVSLGIIAMTNCYLE